MTDTPEHRLETLGLSLPKPFQLPAGMVVPLSFIRIVGQDVYLSGHGALNPDGSVAEPLGQVGGAVSLEQGVEAARLTALAMLRTLKDELGDLSRIDQWVRVFGMVNAAPGFAGHTPVINGFSQLICDVFGHDCGAAARSAVGMSSLPMNMPVEVEAQIRLKS